MDQHERSTPTTKVFVQSDHVYAGGDSGAFLSRFPAPVTDATLHLSILSATPEADTPEPASLWTLAFGVFGLAMLRRGRRSKSLSIHRLAPETELCRSGPADTANKLRTVPLWGLHIKARFMHDNASTTLNDAILRHGGEAQGVTANFKALTPAQQQQLIAFLQSL
jgi:hypothetical protein